VAIAGGETTEAARSADLLLLYDVLLHGVVHQGEVHHHRADSHRGGMKGIRGIRGTRGTRGIDRDLREEALTQG
jgi:hypothetical protein